MSNVVALRSLRGHPSYCQGVEDARRIAGPPPEGSDPIYRAGWEEGQGHRRRFAEDLTPEGIQLVLPGAERKQSRKEQQLNLF